MAVKTRFDWLPVHQPARGCPIRCRQESGGWIDRQALIAIAPWNAGSEPRKHAPPRQCHQPLSTSPSLQGKAVLVTGGGRGLGKAVTHRLAAAGANVVIASRKLENLEATAREFAALPGKVVLIACHAGCCDRASSYTGQLLPARRFEGWATLTSFARAESSHSRKRSGESRCPNHL